MKKATLHSSITKALYARDTQRRIKPYRILVLVNFAEGSRTALSFALKLAKASKGTIDLHHLTDVSEIPDTENPLKYNRIQDDLEVKATGRVNAFRDLITEYGVKVGSSQSTIGHAGNSLRAVLAKLNPDLIVVGNDKLSKTYVSHLEDYNRYPWLIVPEQFKIRTLSKIVLLSDRKPISETKLRSLFVIIQSMAKPLFVVNLNGGRGTLTKYILPSEGVDFRIHKASYEVIKEVSSLDDFIIENQPDLICKVHQPKRFFQRLLGIKPSLSLVNGETVPVLVLPN